MSAQHVALPFPQVTEIAAELFYLLHLPITHTTTNKMNSSNTITMEEKMDDNTMIEDERHMIIKREVWNQQILQELFGKFVWKKLSIHHFIPNNTHNNQHTQSLLTDLPHDEDANNSNNSGSTTINSATNNINNNYNNNMVIEFDQLSTSEQSSSSSSSSSDLYCYLLQQKSPGRLQSYLQMHLSFGRSRR
jgi:hypothetical protein